MDEATVNLRVGLYFLSMLALSLWLQKLAAVSGASYILVIGVCYGFMLILHCCTFVPLCSRLDKYIIQGCILMLMCPCRYDINFRI